MKKIIAILGVLMLFFVISCKEDDCDGCTDNKAASLTGTWKAQKISINGSVTTSAVPVPIPIAQERNNDCTKTSTLVLNEDKSGQMILNDDTSGTCSQMINQSFSYNYNESTNTLEITENGVSQSAMIESLTENSLILKKELQNFEMQGNSFSGTITVEFKK